MKRQSRFLESGSNRLGRLERGRLFVWASDQMEKLRGVGYDAIRHIAVVQKKGVFILAPGQDKELIIQNLLAMEANVGTTGSEANLPGQRAKKQVIARLKKAIIFVDSSTPIDFATLFQVLRYIVRKSKMRALFLDYLEPDNAATLGKHLRLLRQVAEQIDICVVALLPTTARRISQKTKLRHILKKYADRLLFVHFKR